MLVKATPSQHDRDVARKVFQKNRKDLERMNTEERLDLLKTLQSINPGLMAAFAELLDIPLR